jgi:O-antigen/teichoic acid export membrane protein
MVLVFGEGFEAAVAPFRILLVYLASTLINSVFTAALIVARRERLYFGIMLAGSLVTAAVAIAATPMAGIVGTAAAVSAGEVIMTSLFGILLRSSLAEQSARELVPLISAALGMAIVTGGLAWLSAPLAIVAGLVVYAVVIVVMKGLSPDDVQLLREVAG